MPKTDPLTPARKIVALGVLMLLFLGSIGLAQLLVIRQREKLPAGRVNAATSSPRRFSLMVQLPPLFNATAASPDPRIFTLRRGMVDGQKRELGIFFFPFSGKSKSEVEEARKLFEDVSGTSPTMGDEAEVAGFAGVELRADSANAFNLLRCAVVGSRVIAVHYAGPGTVTEADEDMFAAICQEGIAIRVR